jgi:N-methylhydantoinase A/oxoprolinase/acetone carboxylase beta subunit
MVHAALDRWLSNDAVGEMDGRFVVPMHGQRGGLGPRDLAVLDRIGGPMPMAAALTSRLEVAALERLVARGLVMLSGVTPSDASHVLGRLAAWDGAAADKALQLLARRRTGAGERFATGAEPLARAVVDQLTSQTVDCLLEAAFGEDPGFDGEAPRALARHRLTKAGLDQHRGVVEIDLSLGVPVIGLGASAPAYYGAVGERLGCRMILPDHAGVANAIGAVAGQVTQRATALVSSPAEGRFVAHLATGLESFTSVEAALRAAEAALLTETAEQARAAGAVDLRQTVDREVKEVEIEGRRMFIEARVTATASGRPRVAHRDAGSRNSPAHPAAIGP